MGPYSVVVFSLLGLQQRVFLFLVLVPCPEREIAYRLCFLAATRTPVGIVQPLVWELISEHWIAAGGAFSCRFVLDYIPMLNHHAVLETQDIDYDQVRQ